MLDIKEIKRKLKGSRVFLKCINKEEFISKNEVNREILALKEIEVLYYQEEDCDFFGGLQLKVSKSFLEDKDLNIDNMFIMNNEIEYFEIIEGSPHLEDNPTFDDLIDVAVKAYKDGKIDRVKITKGVSGGGGVLINGDRQFTSSRPTDGINFINSLYTETFVIKEFSDTKILKSGAKAVLGNGEEVIFSNKCGVDDALWFEYNDYHSTIIPFIALKGATVTQKRGE